MDDNLKTYKNELIQLLNKSQDHFEKQLSYLSAGAIGVSMAFIERITGKISESDCKLILIIGWLLLTLTLLINLFSHIKAYRNHYKTIEEINCDGYSQTKAIQRNKMINRLNNWSITTLMLGIFSIIIFITLNIYK